MLTKSDKIKGLLLGTAVGDAVGLPAEGISKRRNRKLFQGKWHHRFLPKSGMISDDTEHTIFVAQSLISSSGSPEAFAKRLGWCLRWWLLSLPAGIGFATLRSILKLWIGFPPTKSGVFSAGNGPAMRSAPIGAYFAGQHELLDQFTLHSTKITHTDPKALTGAKAVAYIAAWAMEKAIPQKPGIKEFENLLLSASPEDQEWKSLVLNITSSAGKGLSLDEFSQSIGQEKGISGYIYHSVPVAIYSWYIHFGDFRKTLESVFNCGGDTDTVGAIAGALAGVTVGEKSIPGQWIEGIRDWPRGVSLLMKISDKLSNKNNILSPEPPVRYFWPGILIRNLLFLLIVLLHGFRRLFPPY